MNPYDGNHTPLKRARLPVPPLSRGNVNIIAKVVRFVNTFSKKSQKSFWRGCKKDPIKILREGRDLLFLDTFTLVLTFAARNVIIFL